MKSSASHAEIKAAFRKLAAKYHPDRNADDDDSAVHFKRVNAAWQVLSDEDRRRAYDVAKSAKAIQKKEPVVTAPPSSSPSPSSPSSSRRTGPPAPSSTRVEATTEESPKKRTLRQRFLVPGVLIAIASLIAIAEVNSNRSTHDTTRVIPTSSASPSSSVIRDEPAWSEVDLGDYTISFPGNPTSAPNQHYQLAVGQSTYVTMRKSLSLDIWRPQPVVDEAIQNALLEIRRARDVRSMKTTHDQTHMIGAYPGREITVAVDFLGSPRRYVLFLAVVYWQKLYIARAVVPEDDVAIGERMLASIHKTKKPPGKRTTLWNPRGGRSAATAAAAASAGVDAGDDDGDDNNNDDLDAATTPAIGAVEEKPDAAASSEPRDWHCADWTIQRGTSDKACAGHEGVDAVWGAPR